MIKELSTLILAAAFSTVSAGVISPLDKGWASATTGEQRYNILYQTHLEAIQQGHTIDYSHIDTARLTIPKGAKPIPLTRQTDFKGVVFETTNTSADIFLFTLIGETQKVEISKELIDNGDFTSIPELRNLTGIIVLEDKTPWTVRKEFGYNHYRKDVLYLKNGKAQNKVVSAYNNEQTKPQCTFHATGTDRIVFKNMQLIRTPQSSKKTFIVQMLNESGITIQNIGLTTPANNIYEDQAICIKQCYDVRITDVTVDGTYSHHDKYGYGICMDNIAKFYAARIVSKNCKWGVFGTNNMSESVLENCNINRFDIHCYGRNVTMNNCTISEKYNQFSSIFGTVTFKKCNFVYAIPYLMEPSYNAYVKHTIVLDNCTIEGKNHYAQITKMQPKLDEEFENTRPELHEKYWPEVIIKKLTININEENGKKHQFKIRKKTFKNDPVVRDTVKMMFGVTVAQ